GPGAQHRARRRGVLLCARFPCTSKERWLARSARERLLISFRSISLLRQSPGLRFASSGLRATGYYAVIPNAVRNLLRKKQISRYARDDSGMVDALWGTTCALA